MEKNGAITSVISINKDVRFRMNLNVKKKKRSANLDMKVTVAAIVEVTIAVSKDHRVHPEAEETTKVVGALEAAAMMHAILAEMTIREVVEVTVNAEGAVVTIAAPALVA